MGQRWPPRLCRLAPPAGPFVRSPLHRFRPRPRPPIFRLGLHLPLPRRRFPALFSSPSPAASALRSAELRTLRDCESDLVDRLRRLLMLIAHRTLPLHTIDQLSWDLGLPYDYRETLIPKFPQFFEIFQPPENPRAWVKLRAWDPLLAVSELERGSGGGNEGKGGCLAFPIRFPRGFGLKKKCMQWLAEWQCLPYTSPYGDCSGLDPRTDVAEKRNVGVFHELLHLTIAKKTERGNVSNLRSALQLPQKFTKVFERHPGIFYLSHKMGRQTVVLREGYGGGRELLVKHPLQEIREQYVALLSSASEKKSFQVERLGCRYSARDGNRKS